MINKKKTAGYQTLELIN